jgi:hypothetical protein
MAEVVPLSKEEMAGLLEMRRLLKSLRKYGDEHCDVTWTWHGEKLKRLIVNHSVLVE